MTAPHTAEPAPALKEIFNRARLRHIAAQTRSVYPRFNTRRFLARAELGLDDLSLLQRLRRVTESLHAELPQDYAAALGVLRSLAPLLNHRFVTLTLPDFVALYGLHDFDGSMQALRFFTPYGSAEFGVRAFLRQDQARALAIMLDWARDPNEHVRRLASEGSRPRLPWSFRLDALVADPAPTAAILEILRADPSPYVRKSVANHLNDITKDHPAVVLTRLESWDLDNKNTAWIARHALRTLIKRGDRRALALLGATDAACLRVQGFCITPSTVQRNGAIRLAFQLRSTAATPQRLVVDYAVHFVKQSGAATAKVFKLRVLTLGAGETVSIECRRAMRDLSTRVHYDGRHKLDVLVNGVVVASGFFELET